MLAKKYYLQITTSLFHVNKFVSKRYIFIKSYRQKEWTLAQQVFKNLYSRLLTRWQGSHVGGHYNRIFSGRYYMKIGFSSQRREMLLFLTLTNHQYGCHDVKCKPAIAIHFNLLQVCASFFVCCLAYTVFNCCERLFLCFSQYGGGFIRLNFDKFRVTAPFIKHWTHWKFKMI